MTGGAAVSWLGTGRMGTALVERLLKGGVTATVWNRTPERTAPLADLGAQPVSTLAEAARSDVVFSTLTDDDALCDVGLGAAGLFSGNRAPRVWVDCSTVSLRASTRVGEAAAAHGTLFLAAPVSGNPGVVRSGSAVLAVSGPREGFSEVEPLLGLLGSSVTYVGSGHEARVVKLCTNVLVGVMAQALAEALVLAEKTGVPRGVVMEFINRSVVGSSFTRYKTPAMVDLELRPTFSPEGQRKDLRLALAVAADHEVPMPLVSTAEVAYSRLVASGLGAGLDYAALILQVARDAGLELRPEGDSR